MDTVYDTTVVAYSNGQLSGRRPGNAMDRRLGYLEAFIAGNRRALYNSKLLQEYTRQVRERRNDVIENFLTLLADTGMLVPKSQLSKRDFGRAREVRWPSHDQHLLAAALGGTDATILVTEKALAQCAAGVKREFEATVLLL